MILPSTRTRKSVWVELTWTIVGVVLGSLLTLLAWLTVRGIGIAGFMWYQGQFVVDEDFDLEESPFGVVIALFFLVLWVILLLISTIVMFGSSSVSGRILGILLPLASGAILVWIFLDRLQVGPGQYFPAPF